jgi:hypothetical protein
MTLHGKGPESSRRYNLGWGHLRAGSGAAAERARRERGWPTLATPTTNRGRSSRRSCFTVAQRRPATHMLECHAIGRRGPPTRSERFSAVGPDEASAALGRTRRDRDSLSSNKTWVCPSTRPPGPDPDVACGSQDFRGVPPRRVHHRSWRGQHGCRPRDPGPHGGPRGRRRPAAQRTHPTRAAADLVGRTVVVREADSPPPAPSPVAAADQGVGGLRGRRRDRQQRP